MSHKPISTSLSSAADVDLDDGWLHGAVRCHSPNCNQRPPDIAVSLLVIHNISLPPGQFNTGYIEQFFCNKLPVSEHPYFAAIADLKVSAHCLIKRDGTLIQFVPLHLRAWHAGASHFDGRDNCNDFSIGIELEGTDRLPYTDAQYAKLIAVTGVLLRAYPQLSPERIVGHVDIAPARKSDPGEAFDWARYRKALETTS